MLVAKETQWKENCHVDSGLSYCDHLRDQQNPYTQVVFICRFNSMERIHLGTCKLLSLQAGGLYMQVVFRAGLTVCVFLLHANQHDQ